MGWGDYDSYDNFGVGIEPQTQQWDFNMPQVPNFGNIFGNAQQSFFTPQTTGGLPWETQQPQSFFTPQTTNDYAFKSLAPNYGSNLDEGSSYFSGLTNKLFGDGGWGNALKYGLMGTSLLAPFASRMFGNSASDQAQQDYQNYLNQETGRRNAATAYNQTAQQTAQNTENASTEQAKQWWTEQSRLQPDQVNAIMAQYARALSTGEKAQKKNAAAAGFSRAPSSASMIQALAPGLLQSLTTRNTVPTLKASTISPAYQNYSPLGYPNIPTSTTAMQDLTGMASQLGQYAIGQEMANLSPTNQLMRQWFKKQLGT